MADVFISYAREDQEHAERLAAALAQEDLSVWWDRHIEPGHEFDVTIEAELENAGYVVVLWSERSIGSQFVRTEAREARKHRKLIPVSIDASEPPLEFRAVQRVFLNDWHGDRSDSRYRQLVRSIARQVSEDASGRRAGTDDPKTDKGPQRETDALAPWQTPEGMRVLSKIRQRDVPRLRRAPSLPVAGTVYRDTLADGDEGPELVVIPPGAFLMGRSEQFNWVLEKMLSVVPVTDRLPHEVTISQPFAIGRCPVTFNEYDRFCAATQRDKPDDAWGRGRLPVINVSWDDAQAYCDWLSAQTGRAYRLPSEAEWEYAARAGTTTTFPWGDDLGENRANLPGSGSAWSGKQTSPVGSFEPNAFGVYDMLGNVWEWCQDYWHETYAQAPTNGAAWLEDSGGDTTRRVQRGGSWSPDRRDARVSIRARNEPYYKSPTIGFRVVCSA